MTPSAGRSFTERPADCLLGGTMDAQLRNELNTLTAHIEQERKDRHAATDDVRRAVHMDMGEVRRNLAGLTGRVDALEQLAERAEQAPQRGWRTRWHLRIDLAGDEPVAFVCERTVGVRACGHRVIVRPGHPYITLSEDMRGHVRRAHPTDGGIR